MDLYEAVTDYVRHEMGAAQEIIFGGEVQRGSAIGFALTLLQRRLASSPLAIEKSLKRRLEKLTHVRRSIPADAGSATSQFLETRTLRQHNSNATRALQRLDLPENAHRPGAHGRSEVFDQLDFSLDEYEASTARAEDISAGMTAARTIAELDVEIDVVAGLLEKARVVLHSGDDRKWNELRGIVESRVLSRTDPPAKMIVFTEYSDTLHYLVNRIVTTTGRSESVVFIHGGMSRGERLAAQEEFTHNPDVIILVATDAAGEGLNLQRAHLMVNYDLPWNPNRIEQRFGRIHRIGQRNVCHLWNLVAHETREGRVYARLLTKIETISRAYNGKLFDMLGGEETFNNASLRELLVEAIRFGESPEVQAKLDRVVDAGVAQGLENLAYESSLLPESVLNIDEVRARMEEARARRLQPGYVEAFFVEAFSELGGAVHPRESGLYEVTWVPSVLRSASATTGVPQLPSKFERITFDPEAVPAKREVTLVAPGHPLLDTVLDAVIEEYSSVLSEGTMFVDRGTTSAAEPYLVYLLEQMADSHSGEELLRQLSFAVLRDAEVTLPILPPYLDVGIPNDAERAQLPRILARTAHHPAHHERVLEELESSDFQNQLEHLLSVRESVIDHVAGQTRQRLTEEADFWWEKAHEFSEILRRGGKARLSPEAARSRARVLDARRAERLQELDDARGVTIHRPRIVAVALAVPEVLLGGRENRETRDTREVERRAVDAVLNAEMKLGRTASEMPHFNPGYDVESADSQGLRVFIEVKGRIRGADTFTVTANEIRFAKAQKDRHRLALVSVSPDGSEYDEVRYVTNAFDSLMVSDSSVSLNEDWAVYWERGVEPV